MSMKFVRPNRLCKEIVFADGIGSSGKGMLSHILGYFENIEKQCNHCVFDYVSYYHWANKIETDAAISYLQTEADFQLYHLMISRDVNFRFTDSTSLFKSPNWLKYIKRIFLQEGDKVVDRIIKEKPVLNEAPHDALRNATLFFQSFQNYLKILYIVRDPYELIYDWKRRGFGDRISKDPREFQLSVLDGNNKPIPMFMYSYPFDYNELNEIERLILMIHFCFKSNLEGYQNLDDSYKNNVIFFNFKDFCINPNFEIERISKFLDKKYTNSIFKLLKKENLPRKNIFDSLKAKNELLNNTSSEFHFYINELELLYNIFCNFINDKN